MVLRVALRACSLAEFFSVSDRTMSRSDLPSSDPRVEVKLRCGEQMLFGCFHLKTI
jgi:hypothetical protein